ncbi:TPA: HTH domain-containing protein [Enterobacter hormaechei subsp. xiangfangensis]|uniref:DeoR family transcriptional regulator n=1 Tax=Enterobacter mori TaxID=539813 RepID=UPI00277C1C53|nr:HTH domain-containing protein [Enterobacter hormaechei subsp. xiangfangensis]
MRDRHTIGSRLISIIIEFHKSGATDTITLKEKFNVSERTIHRDLNRLEPMIIKISRGMYCLSTPVQTVLDEIIPTKL